MPKGCHEHPKVCGFKPKPTKEEMGTTKRMVARKFAEWQKRRNGGASTEYDSAWSNAVVFDDGWFE